MHVNNVHVYLKPANEQYYNKLDRNFLTSAYNATNVKDQFPAFASNPATSPWIGKSLIPQWFCSDKGCESIHLTGPLSIDFLSKQVPVRRISVTVFHYNWSDPKALSTNARVIAIPSCKVVPLTCINWAQINISE